MGDKSKNLTDYIFQPKHIVKETKDNFVIDDFELSGVLQNGVTVQKLGRGEVKVNVSFLAKDYEYKFEEDTQMDAKDIKAGTINLSHKQLQELGLDLIRASREYAIDYLEKEEQKSPEMIKAISELIKNVNY